MKLCCSHTSYASIKMFLMQKNCQSHGPQEVVGVQFLELHGGGFLPVRSSEEPGVFLSGSPSSGMPSN